MRASGRAAEGERLKLRIHPFGGSLCITVRPVILMAVPNRELCWLGRLIGVPGLFQGRHSFRIESNGNGGVRLTQVELISGVMVPLFGGSVEKHTPRSFDEMNRALKDRGEQQGLEDLRGQPDGADREELSI